MLEQEPKYIIAIGASAGGMEEINDFFDHTPLDGVSYIIIQHLSADFKSRMVELLSKHSKLVVQEARSAMKIKCNEVYLIPNDKYMTVKDGVLSFTDKNDHKGPHLTINTFFKSLANDCENKAIGIILSGLGSDGTEGIKAIKEAGGMVIARNPETTDFGSMPASAIASGLVDFVLEPEAMPDVIENYVLKSDLSIIESEEDKKYLNKIINLIKETSPLDFSEYKVTTILRRTKRRASSHNITSLSKYYDFIKANPEEITSLSQDFLISVTSFFRDKEAYQSIEKEVIPELLKNLKSGEELKLWVAGCATGEEAYSLAILLHEQINNNEIAPVVKIFATDIDAVALQHAGKGVYTSDISKHISPARLEACFVKEGNYYKVKPAIRRMVIFALHDLVKNPPYCNMQFISCRNLLIYMTPDLQKKIFTMLLFGLRKNGYLFLGSSESPISIVENLEVVNKKWKIYKTLVANRVVRFDAFSLPVVVDKRTETIDFQDDVKVNETDSLAEVVNASLLESLNILVVFITETNQVVKTFGDTSKYLYQKNFNLNLVELLPRPLAVAFNTLSISALKEDKKTALKGIKIPNADQISSLSLSVNPIKQKKGGQRLLMVTFSPDDSPVPDTSVESVFDERIYLDQYTLNLENDLKDLKEKLHNSHLQLNASNENMQSFNEELLSANEEMQSTNEEMQSVNEELHTINTDYQLKNKELLELNDDLNNYFRSNINGQLFVNNDLLLMKFSPGTVKQINLLPTDIGRPLSHISTNIKFENFIEDIKEVIQHGSLISKEIESNDGKWYQILTMPYLKQADNTRNGAIITFSDITELKHVQLELNKRNNSLMRINDDLDSFVHTASHDLLAPLSNIESSISVLNKMEVNNPQVIKFLSIINNSIKKFRGLVKDISAIAKLESDLLTLEAVDLNEILDNIEWSLEDKIKESGTVINRNLEIKQLLFSKKNLRSILYNLISNAIKFKSENAPEITIFCGQGKGFILLSVKDNGIGISKEDTSKIFDLHGRLNRDIDGQGIGLYLVKKIVNATNGNISIESEPGKGSKFSLQFKADQELIELEK